MTPRPAKAGRVLPPQTPDRSDPMPDAMPSPPDLADPPPAPILAPSRPPIEVIDGEAGGGLLLLCDHGSNWTPPEYARLGLPEHELDRHIGYDVGAAEVTRGLARRLRAPAVMGMFCRLLIDPNRGEDDPTLVMRLSDGAVVPGNRNVDAAERAARMRRFYRPYHAAVTAAVEAAEALARPFAIVAIHSFTPHWKGRERPWHVGILSDDDRRAADPLLADLKALGHLVVGDNEPYSGALPGDTLHRHATLRGHAAALVEIRNDLIAAPQGVIEWVDRLAPMLASLSATSDLTARPPGRDVQGRTIA